MFESVLEFLWILQKFPPGTGCFPNQRLARNQLIRQIIIAKPIGGEILMNLAFYGTLRDPDVLKLVMGGTSLNSQATTVAVKGWACLRIEGEAYPLLRSDPDATTTFDLYHDISQESWRRLVDYEGDEYFPGLIEINERSYHVFLAESFVNPSPETWTLELFQTRDKILYLRGLL